MYQSLVNREQYLDGREKMDSHFHGNDIRGNQIATLAFSKLAMTGGWIPAAVYTHESGCGNDPNEARLHRAGIRGSGNDIIRKMGTGFLKQSLANSEQSIVLKTKSEMQKFTKCGRKKQSVPLLLKYYTFYFSIIILFKILP